MSTQREIRTPIDVELLSVLRNRTLSNICLTLEHVVQQVLVSDGGVYASDSQLAGRGHVQI